MEVRIFVPDHHALVGVKVAPLSTSATAATGAGADSTAPLVTIAVVVAIVVVGAAAAVAETVSILTGLDAVAVAAGESAEVGPAEAAGAVRLLACRKL